MFPAAHHRPLCGKDYPHKHSRGVSAAPDYKAMYFELFRASVQAAQLLQDAQVGSCFVLGCQSLDFLPPIRLGQPEKKDEE